MESRNVSYEKVENGYIITLTTEEKTKEGMRWKTRRYITQTAIETLEMLKDLME